MARQFEIRGTEREDATIPKKQDTLHGMARASRVTLCGLCRQGWEYYCIPRNSLYVFGHIHSPPFGIKMRHAMLPHNAFSVYLNVHLTSPKISCEAVVVFFLVGPS